MAGYACPKAAQEALESEKVQILPLNSEKVLLEAPVIEEEDVPSGLPDLRTSVPDMKVPKTQERTFPETDIPEAPMIRAEQIEDLEK